MTITLIVVLYIFNKNGGTVMYSISTVDSAKDFDYSSRNIMILNFASNVRLLPPMYLISMHLRKQNNPRFVFLLSMAIVQDKTVNHQ